MTVAVAKLEGLDTPRAGDDRVADNPGTRAGENRLAVLFPGLVQRLESRGGERLAGLIEPLVEVVAARWCRMRSNLLEIPAQVVHYFGPERRQQLVPNDLFRALGDVREVRWDNDPERPCGECPEQRYVTFEEHSELVQPWVGDDVDDHAAAGEMNADRQAIREVPDGARLSLADADVRQVRLRDPRQCEQVRRLLVGSPEPH